MKCIIIVMLHSCVITLLSWNRLSCPTLFTDDYLIGIQFHTVESSKTPIMHHCLIKLAFFFCTHEILSQNLPFHDSYMRLVLSRIIVLWAALHCPALIHSPRLTNYETKTGAYVRFSGFSVSLVGSSAESVIIPSIGWNTSDHLVQRFKCKQKLCLTGTSALVHIFQ